MKLQGRRILVTRPAAQADTLAGLIAEHGGEAVCFPLIEISAADDPEPLQQAISQLGDYSLAVFISPNAVAYSLPQILAARAWPAALQAGAIGPGTVAQLNANGIDEVVAPDERFDSTALLERAELQAERVAGKRVLILRGNLDTRLRKLDAGQYDAIILAAAGLMRLGLNERIKILLPPEQSLPAPGQGALGIEILSSRSDVAAWLAPLADTGTTHCVRAERAFSRALGGSCQVPLGSHALLENGVAGTTLWLRAFVATPDGQQWIGGELRGAPDDDEALGQKLAQQLREQGADSILAALSAEP